MTFSEDLYSCHISHSPSKTMLRLFTHPHLTHTRYMPHTHYFLSKEFPQVLETRCFNDKNQAFTEEVKHTQSGHLFEHILLAYIAELARLKGYKRMTFKGETRWNWQEDKKGTFHITLFSGFADSDIFKHAFLKSLTLFSRVLRTTQKHEKNLNHAINDPY